MGNDHIKPIVNMLREIGGLAEHASLSGGLSGGEPQAAKRYNSCLRQLITLNAVPAGLFEELDEESAKYGSIGVDARLLASYLRSENESDEEPGRRRKRHQDSNILLRLAPFVRGEDLAELVQKQMREGADFDEDVLASLAPFMPGELLAELVHEVITKKSKSAPSAARPPEPPAEPEAPTEPVQFHATPSLPERRETQEELIAQLRDPNISAEERHEIALRIAGLG